MVPLHKPEDMDKIVALSASMAQDGWVGAPLVLWDNNGQLITGAHRLAAARSLEWDDYDIPTIDIRDIFEQEGLDFYAVQDEEEADWNDFITIINVLHRLSPETRDAYGIDLH